jgi:CDP-2,3-bis-(O-geranylgeranyl)-sn-glycerol synthase
MMKFILSCFYFFLPAYFTNMIPSLSATLRVFSFLGRPIDGGREFKEKPLLGDHKTWRGPVLGAVVGMLALFLQRWFFNNSSLAKSLSIIDYQNINIWLFGLLMVSGAVFGDLFFAFIKRRLDLKPGAKFLPFDQINYVIGVAVFLTLFSEINIAIEVWLTILILTFLLHLAATQLGFLLGLSRSKW